MQRHAALIIWLSLFVGTSCQTNTLDNDLGNTRGHVAEDKTVRQINGTDLSNQAVVVEKLNEVNENDDTGKTTSQPEGIITDYGNGTRVRKKVVEKIETFITDDEPIKQTSRQTVNVTQGNKTVTNVKTSNAHNAIQNEQNDSYQVVKKNINIEQNTPKFDGAVTSYVNGTREKKVVKTNVTTLPNQIVAYTAKNSKEPKGNKTSTNVKKSHAHNATQNQQSYSSQVVKKNINMEQNTSKFDGAITSYVNGTRKKKVVKTNVITLPNQFVAYAAKNSKEPYVKKVNTNVDAGKRTPGLDEVVDYGNGIRVQKKVINSSQMIEQAVNVTQENNTKTLATNVLTPKDIRKIVQEAVSGIVREQRNKKSECNLCNEMKTIKAIRLDIKRAVRFLSKKQDLLIKTLVKNRNATNRAIVQVQSAIKNIGEVQKVKFSLAEKKIAYVYKRVKEIQNNVGKNSKYSKVVNEELKSLEKAEKGIENRLELNVEPKQKIILRVLKDLRERQKTNKYENSNMVNEMLNVKELLKKEIKQVVGYHDSTLNYMKKIQTKNQNIEHKLSNLTHMVANDMKSIQAHIQFNAHKIAKEVDSIENKTRKLIAKIEEIVEKQTVDVLISTNYVRRSKSSGKNLDNKILQNYFMINQKTMAKKIQDATEMLLERITKVKNSIEAYKTNVGSALKNTT